MKTRKIIWGYLVVAFLISCSSSSNKENFELGTLQIVDHGPAIPSSWETHIIVDSTGKITSTQYSVQDGVITVPTYTWEYQMSPSDKNLVEQECTTADILYRGDVILPDGVVPCTGAGNLAFHTISKSGRENRFAVSGEVRCVSFDHIPAAINAFYSTITGWAPVYAQ
jgi:hypothetical protein